MRELSFMARGRCLKRWALTVVGHDTGALVAQKVARDSPGSVSGIALLCPPPVSILPYVFDFLSRPLQFIANFTALASRSFLTSTEACRTLFFAPDTPLVLVEKHMVRMREAKSGGRDMLPSGQEALLGTTPPPSFSRVLVVAGSEDRLIPPAVARATLEVYEGPGREAEMVVLEGAGHDLMLSHPRELLPHLVRFAKCGAELLL